MERNLLSLTNRFDKLALFSFAWAVANVLHALSFADRINLQHPFAIAVVLAASLVIAVPWSIWPFLLMLCCSVANTLEWMPYAPNHITFEFIINSGILSTLVWLILRVYLEDKSTATVSTSDFRNLVFHTFAPFVRVSLFILYFYAVLHKLNWDYFNVNISCSTFLLSGYEKRLPFIPDTAFVRWSSVWGTIIIEAAIPLLLYFRKTRLAGIVLGCGFHYFLALHPHRGLYSFSAMLFAIYCLFLPENSTIVIQTLADTILSKRQDAILRLCRLCFSIVVVMLVVMTATDYIGNIVHNIILTGFFIWLLWGVLLMIILSYIILRSASSVKEFESYFKMQNALLWLIPLIVLFNGMTPYLGIKTQTNFSMFSNLRTEGGITNHMFIPSSLQIGGRERDLVEVTSTNLKPLQDLVDNHQLIPYFEFKRITSDAHTDFYATYIRANKVQNVKVIHGVSNKPELLVSHSWLAAKFIRFRPVDKGPCLCKH